MEVLHASAFILQPALDRPNLTLRTDTHARTIRLRDGRAVAVECAGPDGAVTLYADRIVVSAGAIASAHLLMLSGIGPQDVLRAAGVPVAVDLPVGVDTVDHPEWVLPVSWPPTQGRPPLEAVLTTAEGVEAHAITGREPPPSVAYNALDHGPIEADQLRSGAEDSGRLSIRVVEYQPRHPVP